MRSSTRTSSLIVVGVLVVIYAVSGPRTLPEADSGELAAVAVCGGIPHPPGYPLLSLALQLFARLSPWLGLIPALTAFSVLSACAAAWICMRVLAVRGYSPLISAIATLAVFLSSHVWRAATSFEPFALNLLLASGVLWTCERVARSNEHATSDTAALGALFGLGLCNHHSLITLAPLAMCALLCQPMALPRKAAMFLLGAALGATPLLAFLYLRTQSGFVWGDWQAFWPRVLEHVLRREYGSFALVPQTNAGSWSYGPARFLVTLPRALSFVFLLPLGLGLWQLLRRTRSERNPERQLDLGIVLSLLTSGVLFPLLFRLQGTQLDHIIADRFFALPVLLLLVPIAEGLLQFTRTPNHIWIWGVSLGMHALLVWPQAERRTRQFYENHVRNIFEALPPNATLMVAADGGFSGGLYGRCALHREDVQLVITSLGHAWYVEQLAAARRAASVDPSKSPLYQLDVPDLQRTRPPPSYPVGPLLRVITDDASIPSPREVFEQNRSLFERLRLPTREAIGGFDAWEAEELANYARSWHLIGQRLEAAGDKSLATTAYEYRDLFQR